MINTDYCQLFLTFVHSYLMIVFSTDCSNSRGAILKLRSHLTKLRICRLNSLRLIFLPSARARTQYSPYVISSQNGNYLTFLQRRNGVSVLVDSFTVLQTACIAEQKSHGRRRSSPLWGVCTSAPSADPRFRLSRAKSQLFSHNQPSSTSFRAASELSPEGMEGR